MKSRSWVVGAGLVVGLVVSGAGCLQVIGYKDAVLASDDGGTDDGGDGGDGSVPATCFDGVKNGNETDKDCGGSCSPCSTGEGCKTGDDCESKSCGPGGICVASTCADKSKNGTETDVDCGGGACEACAFGKTCAKDDDCVTGFCDGAKCAVRTIVEGLTNPNSLAVDSVNAYWADGDLGVVMATALAGGAATEIATGQTKPQGLVIVPGKPNDLDPSFLAWVEVSAGRVNRASFGSKAAPLPSYSGGHPQAVVPGALYWTNAFTPSNSIMTHDQAMPSAPQLLTPLSGMPFKIVSAGPNSLVFTMQKSAGWDPWGLWSVATTTNATPTLLASYSDPQSKSSGLAVDEAGFVYWADDVAGTVAKVNVTGGTPEPVATQQEAPTDVAVDSLHVYWLTQGTSPGGGAVMKTTLSGGSSPVVLAPGQDTPRGLFLSGNNVYWLSGATGQGAVRSVRK